ncbi:putative aldo-keto reductase [Bimuria novae-zelandiae CBS 107.79]|uniref:Putative aldo-keto reductase n=1 Tax=Bimuria novae-zelandiae CBS 107.79 TaxID=1447943 RepID=A0A6A5VM57_9PLEO|nr:putative aldo-keto reductase [Bimuria novae-zelandiae CBS 107.79]
MMSLPTAPLGKNGPQVTRLGFGLMGLSVFYGTAKPDPERLALLDAAHEMGEHFWDTADMYGDNEDLLGKWFKANPDKRSDIFLATKFANRQMPDGSYKIDSTPEYAKEACNKSLERLGLPSVDLYYVHRLDKVTPVEKTIQAMVELKNEGKIKYLGISECSAESLRRAHAVHPITAIQVEYSPFALEIESKEVDLLRTARELGVAIVAYSPLSRGILTGTYKSPNDFEEGDFRRMMPRFSQENFPKNLKLVDQLAELAKKKGVTTGQLVMAWLMAQGVDIFPIPGTQRVERLKENVGALDVKLSKEEEQEIRKAVNAADVKGDRYREAFMAYAYADTPPL